jgi:branched-chain amino acid transport system substrate-binding protein
MINEQGGVNGRRINFISYDDAYSPPKTVEQARRLIENDEVFLLFNVVGTPGNAAIQKYVNQKRIPHVFISSGDSRWNDPHNFPWSLAWWPSFKSEARIYAKYIQRRMGSAKRAGRCSWQEVADSYTRCRPTGNFPNRLGPRTD